MHAMDTISSLAVAASKAVSVSPRSATVFCSALRISAPLKRFLLSGLQLGLHLCELYPETCLRLASLREIRARVVWRLVDTTMAIEQVELLADLGFATEKLHVLAVRHFAAEAYPKCVAVADMLRGAVSSVVGEDILPRVFPNPPGDVIA